MLPPNNKDKDAGHYRGTGIFPAENHILLLEDEPSHCKRNGLVWKLKEVTSVNSAARIVASRQPKDRMGNESRTPNHDLRFRHPYLAGTRIHPHLGSDLGKSMARQVEKKIKRPIRPFGHHLETGTRGRTQRCLYQFSYLGYLAGRSID